MAGHRGAAAAKDQGERQVWQLALWHADAAPRRYSSCRRTPSHTERTDEVVDAGPQSTALACGSGPHRASGLRQTSCERESAILAAFGRQCTVGSDPRRARERTLALNASWNKGAMSVGAHERGGGGRDVKRWHKYWLLAIVPPLLGGCGLSPSASSRPSAHATWHVGPFTVRPEMLPSSALNNPHEQLVGSDTVLRIGTTPPYVISLRKLGSRHWSDVSSLGCSQQPAWQGVEGPQRALLCAGATGIPNRPTQLVLVDAQGGVTAYDLPVHLPRPVFAGSVTGIEFGPQSTDVIWYAMGISGLSPNVGSGMIDLGTSMSLPIPAEITQPANGQAGANLQSLSPNDSLYVVKFPPKDAAVYRWSSGTNRLQFLGDVPDQRVDATSDDGTMWALEPDPKVLYRERFVEEAPGSGHATSWTIRGAVVGDGPGYIAYTPLTAAGVPGSSVDLYFPVEHRTLHFSAAPPADTPTGSAAFMGSPSPGINRLQLQMGNKTEVVMITGSQNSSRPLHQPAGYRAQGRSCISALRVHGVGKVMVVSAGPWPRVTLAASLEGGPLAAPNHASAIETATWSVLSASAGKSLAPYLGQTVSVVRAQPGTSSRIASYVCLESGAKVIGLYAQGSQQNGQPMYDVSVTGRTVAQRTKSNYLRWLETTKAYEPHPKVNNPGLPAQAVLLDYFDTINAGLPAAQEDRFLATLATPRMAAARRLPALVPISITRVTNMGLSTTMSPELQAEFEVQIWSRPAGMHGAAGNGMQDMFYVVERTSKTGDWIVTNAGSGP